MTKAELEKKVIELQAQVEVLTSLVMSRPAPLPFPHPATPYPDWPIPPVMCSFEADINSALAKHAFELYD